DSYDIENAISREMRQVKLPLDDEDDYEGESDEDFGDDEGARPSKQRSASGKISLFGAGMADVEDSGAKKDRVNLRTHRRVKGVDPSTWSGYAGVEPLDKVIKMSAQDLKKLCGEHGFPTSGNKQDMIRRLAD
ncbi:unnamed protein product, partial [Symbiodinium sp. KB8]